VAVVHRFDCTKIHKTNSNVALNKHVNICSNTIRCLISSDFVILIEILLWFCFHSDLVFDKLNFFTNVNFSARYLSHHSGPSPIVQFGSKFLDFRENDDKSEIQNILKNKVYDDINQAT
jgi:hypothetical protein